MNEEHTFRFSSKT